MPYLKEVVDQINTELSNEAFSFAPFIPLFNGISELIPTTEGGDAASFPAMYDADGLGEFTSIDDRYNLVAYHRCLGRSYANEGVNFGDFNDNYVETNQMLLCIWAKKNDLRMTKETIQDKIVLSLPTDLSAQFKYDYAGINAVYIAANDINSDSRSVWAQEFAGYDYQLSTSDVLFTLTYSVEIKYRKSCISDCQEC